LAALCFSRCSQLRLICKFVWEGVVAQVAELEAQSRNRPVQPRAEGSAVPCLGVTAEPPARVTLQPSPEERGCHIAYA